MRIDLHLHSTASDGVYTPSEVVQFALTHQMDVIALTDHDSMEGVAEARAAADGTGLTVLAGLELSAEVKGRDCHMLGYMIDPAAEPFRTTLADLRGGRINRAQRIVEKLAALGLEVPLARVYELAGEGAVGRPHIARAMLERGLVGSLQEAFDRYLSDDGPAFVPHARLEPEDAIRLIHQAGGVAVMAHPGRVENYHSIIDRLIPVGLDGLEVYYPEHTPDIIAELHAVANQHQLVMTVGSDFHRREGDGSTRIGSVKFPTDFDPILALHERVARYRHTAAS